jgi:hydrogenase 3 maturation protease
MLELLSKRLEGRVMILGVGNTLRGDDGVGPYLVKQLEGRVDAILLDCGEVPENFLGKITEIQPDNILIIDAVNLGADPGAVAILHENELASAGWSTHHASIKLFLKCLKADTRSKVLIIGIQPKSTGFGTEMSAEVRKTVSLLREIILKAPGIAKSPPPRTK